VSDPELWQHCLQERDHEQQHACDSAFKDMYVWIAQQKVTVLYE